MPKQAPQHLRKPTRDWWRQVVSDYELEPHHVRLLTLAAEAWDRAQEARETIDREGAYYQDRFGQPKGHPALATERDSRIAFARLMRELDLDGSPAPDSRPPRVTASR
jgi:P27 family predicted phage terminase small subunit